MREVTVHVFDGDSSAVDCRVVPLADDMTLGAFLSQLPTGLGSEVVPLRVIHNGAVIRSLDNVRSGDHLHVMPGRMPSLSAPDANTFPSSTGVIAGPRSLLADLGFTPEEVRDVHTALRRQYGSEQTAEQLEQQWLNSEVTREEAVREDMAQEDTQGTELHTFIGMVYGFFLGLLSVLALGSTTLKQKTRIGIVVGMMANMFLSNHNFQDGARMD